MKISTTSFRQWVGIFLKNTFLTLLRVLISFKIASRKTLPNSDMSERVLLFLINFMLGWSSIFWIAISTGLVESNDSSLNLASSLFMLSLLTAFLKKLLIVSATFYSFEGNLPFSANDI